MKIIQLTKGKCAKVDDDDYLWLSRFKWYASTNPNGDWYASSSQPENRSGTRITFMHRLIMDAGPGEQIDHANLDGLDNQRANLRKCTGGQNQTNQPKHSGTSSIYKGVCWDRSKKKWKAQIGFQKKHIFLGHFDSQAEAAKAYDAASIELYGEFARTNFSES